MPGHGLLQKHRYVFMAHKKDILYVTSEDILLTFIEKQQFDEGWMTRQNIAIAQITNIFLM